MIRLFIKVSFSLLLILGFGCAKSQTPPLALGEERVQDNEAEISAQMVTLIQQISRQRLADTQTGQGEYYHRFNQVKTLGCFQGQLQVPALPEALAVGLFATPNSYPVFLRFANASTFDDKEKDLRGASMRVSFPDSDGVKNHTLLMNSYPVLFAGTPEVFLKFIQATAEGRVWWFFINPFDSHFKALRILFKARQNHTSPFDIPYYTTTPFRYGGPERAAKFSLEPCSIYKSEPSDALSQDYLQKNMTSHLTGHSVCFKLRAQFQNDPVEQPIEDASVLWDEQQTPWHTVGEVKFSQQDFLQPQQLLDCEREVFDPWETHPAHTPIGGINRVRKEVYHEMSKFRLESHEQKQ